MTRAVVALALALVTTAAGAHEVRPAYLGISEIQADRYAIIFKVPQLGDNVLSLRVVLPDTCVAVAQGRRELLGAAATERRIVDCPGGLAGKRVGIDGLEVTMTDALLRIDLADGGTQSVVLKPLAASVQVDGRPSGIDVLRGYGRLGVEHILSGIDHLIFVLALLLIVRGTRPLVLTVTAFTVAHSITLALATFGVVRVPQAPVETVIALSIAFVAAEILRVRAGEVPLTARAPWIVAFAFGLLHGLGFAGALAEVGLPPGDIPLALLAFNLGVEVGQLAFVAVVLAVIALVRRVCGPLPRWAGAIPAYAIGSVAMFWTVQRVAAF